MFLFSVFLSLTDDVTTALPVAGDDSFLFFSCRDVIASPVGTTDEDKHALFEPFFCDSFGVNDHESLLAVHTVRDTQSLSHEVGDCFAELRQLNFAGLYLSLSKIGVHFCGPFLPLHVEEMFLQFLWILSQKGNSILG